MPLSELLMGMLPIPDLTSRTRSWTSVLKAVASGRSWQATYTAQRGRLWPTVLAQHVLDRPCWVRCASERAAGTDAVGRIQRGRLRSHSCAIFAAPKGAQACKNMTTDEAAVMLRDEGLAGGRIAQSRRPEPMCAHVDSVAQAATRRLNGQGGLQRLAPEGCWFESNRGSQRALNPA